MSGNVERRNGKYPPRLIHPVIFENGISLIYSGEILLRNNLCEILIDGKVEFKLIRYPKVVISGMIKSENSIKDFNHHNFEILIEGIVRGDMFVTDMSLSSIPEKSLLTGISKNFYWQIIDTKEENILFVIPNFRELHGGDIIADIQENKHSQSMGRFVFSGDEYSLLMDKVYNIKDKIKDLKFSYGYDILYVGSLTPPLAEDALSRFNIKLSVFLSFINGQKSSSILNTGMANGKPVWIDFSTHIVEPYQYVSSWSLISFPDFEELWKEFSELWKDELDKDFLITAIHWYSEANSNAGKIEGSIILIQAALELIYNWLIVEKLGILDRIKNGKISAEDKITLILEQMNVDKGIPESYKHLVAFKPRINGPKVFTEIRNALVHGDVKNRKKMLKASSFVTFEALHLGIWYVELALLFILKYKGKYCNRTDQDKWLGEGVNAPWTHKNE